MTRPPFGPEWDGITAADIVDAPLPTDAATGRDRYDVDPPIRRHTKSLDVNPWREGFDQHVRAVVAAWRREDGAA